MAGWNPNQKFTMPMFRPWVPEKVRPWMYVVFAALFQLSSGVYFANLQHMMGATSLMREDIQMVAMFGVVGVNMPFPFLFRYKLRFTNQQLLINAALVIAACNLLCLWLLTSQLSIINSQLRLPLLCAISYIAGYFKLCGTFECFSNIRLWLSPKQDFGIFLPSLYIIILAAMPGSNWIAQQLCIMTDSWQSVHWLMTALMLVVALLVFICTQPWRMMPFELPLVSLDWLGCFLWSALMLQIIWLFTYGEYYNWWDSALWRSVLVSFPITLLVCIGRMRHIRHPYIDPKVWPHARLIPILAMFFVAEVMNATPHALQGTLTGGVLHWGFTTTQQFYVFEMLGYAAGCVFTILWGKGSWGKIPRFASLFNGGSIACHTHTFRCEKLFTIHSSLFTFKYTRLLSVGFAALLAYQIMMYFYVSPTLNVERLWLPTFLRTFGYAIFFATMTIYLKDLIEFPTFFMALTVSGFIRNGVAESVCSGLYSYGLRRQIADALSRGIHSDYTQVLMVAVKEMFGVMCLIGTFTLLLMLLYDVQPVRSTMKRMLPLRKLVKMVTRQMRQGRLTVTGL